MPFNVRIRSNGAYAKLGLEKQELIDRIVAPWNEGRKFVMGGRTFDPYAIAELHITEGREGPDHLIRLVEHERFKTRRTSRYLTSVDWDAAKIGDDVTDEYITGPPGHLASTVEAASAQGENSSPTEAPDPRVVFVVYGRNIKARDALYSFLGAIGLRPLEFSQATKETRKGAPYIGEILDQAFAKAAAVVVLLTPDDEARLLPVFQTENDGAHETEYTPQARQNVLFEGGMAFGRHPDRTVLVQIGAVRPFTDVAGRHIVRLDNSPHRRKELADKLSAAGCPVSLDGEHWLTVGDFDLAM
jgi:predicted nucleotide-binding protein